MATNVDVYVDAYMGRFIHVTEHYARQFDHARAGYLRVAEPVTRAVVQAHVRGDRSIGLYLLDARDQCRYGVLDHDGYRLDRDADGQVRRSPEDGVRVLQGVRQRLAQHGLDAAVESSRRGAHLWIFASEPVAARDMRALLSWAADGRAMELYPKQDTRGSGVGSLIRAPLGVHRVSGRRYGFLAASGDLVAPTIRGHIDYLATVLPVDVRQELARRPHLRDGPVTLGTGASLLDGCDAPLPPVPTSPGDRSVIRAWLEAVRCEDVVRAYLRLDRRGVGHCPWPEHHAHGDRAASFQVLARVQRWKCYATEETGNAFDFVCRMERATPKEALAYCLERWPLPQRSREGRGR